MKVFLGMFSFELLSMKDVTVVSSVRTLKEGLCIVAMVHSDQGMSRLTGEQTRQSRKTAMRREVVAVKGGRHLGDRCSGIGRKR
jgi:hypothetical protein